MQPLGGPPPIDTADGPFAEVELHIECDLDGPDYDGAGQVGQAIFVARLALGAFEMVVVPIDAFEMAGGFVFGRDRIVEIDVDVLGSAGPLGLLDGPTHHEGAERLAHLRRRPGTHAQAVGHVGDIGTVDQLAPQGGQGLARLADQQGVDHVEQMPPLWLREVEVQLIRACAKSWG